MPTILQFLASKSNMSLSRAAFWARARAFEPVVDRRAEAAVGNGSGGYAQRAGFVQGAQIGEEIRGGLDEVS